jgi:hypothetical protein
MTRLHLTIRQAPLYSLQKGPKVRLGMGTVLVQVVQSTVGSSHGSQLPT